MPTSIALAQAAPSLHPSLPQDLEEVHEGVSAPSEAPAPPNPFSQVGGHSTCPYTTTGELAADWAPLGLNPLGVGPIGGKQARLPVSRVGGARIQALQAVCKQFDRSGCIFWWRGSTSLLKLALTSLALQARSFGVTFDPIWSNQRKTGTVHFLAAGLNASCLEAPKRAPYRVSSRLGGVSKRYNTPKFNTWEPEENLGNAKEILSKYLKTKQMKEPRSNQTTKEMKKKRRTWWMQQPFWIKFDKDNN